MSAEQNAPAAILWLTDWEVALAAARRARKPVMIDVSKDP